MTSVGTNTSFRVRVMRAPIHVRHVAQAHGARDKQRPRLYHMAQNELCTADALDEAVHARTPKRKRCARYRHVRVEARASAAARARAGILQAYPMHPILAPGGSEGAISHWVISSQQQAHLLSLPLPLQPLLPQQLSTTRHIRKHSRAQSALSVLALQIPARDTLTSARLERLGPDIPTYSGISSSPPQATTWPVFGNTSVTETLPPSLRSTVPSQAPGARNMAVATRLSFPALGGPPVSCMGGAPR